MTKASDFRAFLIIISVLFTSAFMAFFAGNVAVYVVKMQAEGAQTASVLSSMASTYHQRMTKGQTLDEWVKGLKNETR
jgi:hypothetical protein